MLANAIVRFAPLVSAGRMSRIGPRMPPFQLAKMGELGGAVVPLLRRETMPARPVVIMLWWAESVAVMTWTPL